MKALIIGDVMLDRYLYGKVNRISPEAPVPILDYTHTEEKLGGAGNVALNFKKLGIDVDIISIIGKDVEGAHFIELLEEYGINTEYILRQADRITSLKTRAMAGQQHLLRVDREEKKALDKNEVNHIVNQIDVAFKKKDYDIVILQDYNKGIFTGNSIPAVLNQLNQYNTTIGVDPKLANFWEYTGVDIMKPNLQELSAILGKQVRPTVPALKQASIELEERLKNSMSVITLSEHGIFLHKGNNHLLMPAEFIDIVDVCGAGDAVIAVLSLAVAAEMPMSFTASISNMAGKIVCKHVGVVPVGIGQITTEVQKIVNKI